MSWLARSIANTLKFDGNNDNPKDEQQQQSDDPSSSFNLEHSVKEGLSEFTNPTFIAVDGVASKDIHIDPFTSLSLRLFLPDTQNLSKNTPSTDIEHAGVYGGYSPVIDGHCHNCQKLPVILQFHGGGFICGSNDAVANDLFCRKIAKQLDAMVVAVGYRLAPESRYPVAFEDGEKVLHWLGKQVKLAVSENRMVAASMQAVES